MNKSLYIWLIYHIFREKQAVLLFFLGLFEKKPQLSYKKLPAAAPRGQSWGQIFGLSFSRGRKSTPSASPWFTPNLAPRSIRRSRQTILNAAPLVARRMAHARFAFRKTKSDKITFSNSNFLPLKKIEKQAFRWFYGISVKKVDFPSKLLPFRHWQNHFLWHIIWMLFFQW